MLRVMNAPQSPPCVTNLPYPSTSTMSVLKALAVVTGPNPDFFGASPGPKPGILGTMTWKACVSGEEGSVRGLMILRASRKEPGQPWTKSKGMAVGEADGWCAKWMICRP